ncbi:MAG: class I SAM-dependent methyltransferase [Pseudomonadota bacterium]
MKECSKSIVRRLHDPDMIRRVFRGVGVDIGGKPDPLVLYKALFPLMESVRTWDLEDGDAQDMAGLPDASMDFVHSSHCLEHMRDPAMALGNWFRILRPGGHLILTVPDEDLYEQGVFPSTFNRDHKWTFTVFKSRSWSPRSLNLIDLVKGLGEACDVRHIKVIDLAYRYDLPRYDQTLGPVSESAIEVLIRKRPEQEVAQGGRLPATRQPDDEVRLHLNQYRDDQRTLRESNPGRPPFKNLSEL